MSYDDVRALCGTLGLIFFMVVFASILWWAYRPKNKKEMEEHGNIPLNEDDDR